MSFCYGIGPTLLLTVAIGLASGCWKQIIKDGCFSYAQLIASSITVGNFFCISQQKTEMADPSICDYFYLLLHSWAYEDLKAVFRSGNFVLNFQNKIKQHSVGDLQHELDLRFCRKTSLVIVFKLAFSSNFGIVVLSKIRCKERYRICEFWLLFCMSRMVH